MTGYGGVPLVGNDPSGDYVVSFTVDDPADPADPLNRTSDNVPNSVQDLGVLFPRELQSGVSVTGTLAASAPGATPDTDTYTIQLLEPQEYLFTLTGPASDPTNLPSNVLMTITDATGTPVTPSLLGNDSNTLYATLDPGSYTISINRASGATSLSVPYELQVTMQYAHENPPPLAIGATPVLQIRLASNPPPTLPANPVQGPTSVVAAAYVTATSAESQGSSDGTSLATQPPLFNIALALQADPVGVVTSVTTSTSAAVASSPPVQVQIPTNAPASAAGNIPVFRTAFLSVLIVGSSTPAIDPSPDTALLLADSVWASWREWVGPWTHWLEFLPRPASPSTSVPQLGPPDTSRVEQELLPVPTVLGLRNESSGNSRTIPDVIQLQQEAVRSAPVVPLQSEETAAAKSTDDPSDSGTNEPARNSLAWLGALVVTALSAFSLWRTFHAPEAHDSPDGDKHVSRSHTLA